MPSNPDLHSRFNCLCEQREEVRNIILNDAARGFIDELVYDYKEDPEDVVNRIMKQPVD